MSKPAFAWQAALARMLIGALGGYALAISFMLAGAGALLATGWLPRSDAVMATGMLAFLVWAGAVLVAFGAPSVARAAAWVLGGAAGCAVLGGACLALAGAP